MAASAAIGERIDADVGVLRVRQVLTGGGRLHLGGGRR